jgi:hypothetical protein
MPRAPRIASTLELIDPTPQQFRVANAIPGLAVPNTFTDTSSYGDLVINAAEHKIVGPDNLGIVVSGGETYLDGSAPLHLASGEFFGAIKSSGASSTVFEMLDSGGTSLARTSAAVAMDSPAHEFAAWGLNMFSTAAAGNATYRANTSGWGYVLERDFFTGTVVQHEAYLATEASERPFILSFSPSKIGAITSITSGAVVLAASPVNNYLVEGMRFVFPTLTGTVTGLTANTFYWVKTITDDTHFTFSETQGGAQSGGSATTGGTMERGNFGSLGYQVPVSITVGNYNTPDALAGFAFEVRNTKDGAGLLFGGNDMGSDQVSFSYLFNAVEKWRTSAFPAFWGIHNLNFGGGGHFPFQIANNDRISIGYNAEHTPVSALDVNGTVTATAFSGSVAAASETGDTTCFPLFATASTGGAPKTNPGLTFDAANQTLRSSILDTDYLVINGSVFIPAGYGPVAGSGLSVNTSGTTVTGTGVGTAYPAPGDALFISGQPYEVASVTNANEVELTTSAGTQTAVQPFTPLNASAIIWQQLNIDGTTAIALDTNGNVSVDGGFSCDNYIAYQYYLTGAAVTPSISFNTDRDTGFYNAATNQVGIATGGVNAATFSATALTLAGAIELGHASDTTMARVSPGVVSIEGVNIITATTINNATLPASFTTLANSGAQTTSVNVAASTPAHHFTGTLYTGGTGTTTFPAVFHQPTGTTAATTWSSGANNGTVFGANEATGFTGNFADFKVAGGATSKFKVAGDGIVTTANRIDIGGRIDCAGYVNANAGNNTIVLYTGSGTSAYWALKRSGTTMAVRLGDDTGDAPITASAATFSSTLSVTGASTLTGAVTFGATAKLKSYTVAGMNAIASPTIGMMVVVTDSTTTSAASRDNTVTGGGANEVCMIYLAGAWRGI